MFIFNFSTSCLLHQRTETGSWGGESGSSVRPPLRYYSDGRNEEEFSQKDLHAYLTFG